MGFSKTGARKSMRRLSTFAEILSIAVTLENDEELRCLSFG